MATAYDSIFDFGEIDGEEVEKSLELLAKNKNTVLEDVNQHVNKLIANKSREGFLFIAKIEEEAGFKGGGIYCLLMLEDDIPLDFVYFEEPELPSSEVIKS